MGLGLSLPTWAPMAHPCLSKGGARDMPRGRGDKPGRASAASDLQVAEPSSRRALLPCRSQWEPERGLGLCLPSLAGGASV